MWGQISSLRTGYNRVCDLCAKYGKDTVLDSMRRLMDQGELAARNRLKEMPKGVWEAENWMDDDGHGNPVYVKVKVTISDDGFIADFTGSNPQVLNPINTGYSSLCAGVRVAFMSIINPELAVNDGVFRQLRVVAEQSSIMMCNPPAPTSCYYESMIYACDVIWKALAPVFPEYLGAGHLLSVCAVILTGAHHVTGLPFLIVEPTGGGWGASRGKDGEVGQFCVGDGDTYNVPVVMADTRYGIRIDEYSLHTDGKGAGEFRGGSGAIRTYRALTDGQLFSGSFGRNKYPAWGAAGGQDGSYNYFEFHKKDGSVDGPYGLCAGYVMNKYDYVRMFTCTGGGYGYPLKRDPARVSSDVRNGYITPAQAEEDYGVCIDPKTFEILAVNRSL
jgi:N-methylhydantoinase B